MKAIYEKWSEKLYMKLSVIKTVASYCVIRLFLSDIIDSWRITLS